MSSPEQQARELKMKQLAEQRAALYREVFSAPKGKELLADLRETFGLEKRTFTPVKKSEGVFAYDPLTAALNDGARTVVIHIQEMLRAPIIDQQPKKKVNR